MPAAASILRAMSSASCPEPAPLARLGSPRYHWVPRMQVITRPPLLFRRRRADDDAFIANLSARAFAEYSKNPEWTTLEMSRRGTTWLAWRADRPIGFAIYEVSGHAELTAIAVEEQARGAGVGAALLAHVERDAASAGIRELRLHTAAANLSALELFLKRGYRVIRRLPRFYRGVYDACQLGKLLHSVAR
jgi:ribosomal protein S18 acetylase RimI-like enzyme